MGRCSAPAWSTTTPSRATGSRTATRSTRAARGPIRAELRAKGVDQARIDEALDESGGEDDDRAYQAGLKRLGLLERLDEETFRRRMYAYLQRRGFDYESARSATERLWARARRVISD